MKEKWLNDLQARIQKEYHVSAPEGLLDDIKSEMQRLASPEAFPPAEIKNCPVMALQFDFYCQPWLSSDYI